MNNYYMSEMDVLAPHQWARLETRWNVEETFEEDENLE